MWQKAMGALPDDPLLHQAVLAWRLGLFVARTGPAPARPGLDGPAAADGEPRPRDVVPPAGPRRRWVLYTQSSPSASGGRGLCAGRMFTQSGTLIATVAQGGMIRVKE